MHYITHTPGTIATITPYPTNIGHEDVNLLSRFITSFNEYVKRKHNSCPSYRHRKEDFHAVLLDRAKRQDLLLPR